jgi:hypothetical protein
MMRYMHIVTMGRIGVGVVSTSSIYFCLSGEGQPGTLIRERR